MPGMRIFWKKAAKIAAALEQNPCIVTLTYCYNLLKCAILQITHSIIVKK